ncbi:MAG: Mov34/MPN/PAD-1 family protein [Halosimplex sp.]
MGLFRSGEVVGIAEAALEFALEASEDSHPNEYMGFLRGEDARKFDLDYEGTVLTDILVIPGTESNPVSATVDASMIPTNSRAAGSIHSHPNGVLRPSNEDLQTFGKGTIHIIIGAPYDRTDWQAFDRQGDPVDLPVLDVEMPEDEFFDFSQADIDAELAEESGYGTDSVDYRSEPDDERGER